MFVGDCVCVKGVCTRKCGHVQYAVSRFRSCVFTWESRATFKCEYDWCNGAPLSWILVSKRSANWGLSGISGKKHLRLLCSCQSHGGEGNALSLVRIRRREKKESAFINNHHSSFWIIFWMWVNLYSTCRCSSVIRRIRQHFLIGYPVSCLTSFVSFAPFYLAVHCFVTMSNLCSQIQTGCC